MTNEGYLTVADAMTPTAASVTAGDTVATAAAVMRRENLAGLPVVAKDRVVGFVTPLQLLEEPPYRPVGTIMTREIAFAAPGLSLQQAYALMARLGAEVIPVVDAGNVVGQISINAVLKAQGQQTDPLTGLLWATALRSWASAALAHGREITILFIDLDDFGEVNKVLGHVAGDDILRSIAHLLANLVDPATDLLCRYGGDEFAVATTRQGDAVRALASHIEDEIVIPVDMKGVFKEISVSIGVAGGRRGENRQETHAPATVEDLLVLASRDSTAVKKAKGKVPATSFGPLPSNGSPDPGSGGPRMRLMNVDVRTSQGRCTAIVTLRLGVHEGVGHAAGPVSARRDVLALVAEATLAAIRLTAGEQYAYVLEDLTEVPASKVYLVVAVLAGLSNGAQRYVGGAAADDPNRAVTKAVLDAVNRPLAKELARQARE